VPLDLSESHAREAFPALRVLAQYDMPMVREFRVVSLPAATMRFENRCCPAWVSGSSSTRALVSEQIVGAPQKRE
jgi:hypothetical protein